MPRTPAPDKAVRATGASLIAVVLVLVLLFGRFLSTDLRESKATT